MSTCPRLGSFICPVALGINPSDQNNWCVTTHDLFRHEPANLECPLIISVWLAEGFDDYPLKTLVQSELFHLRQIVTRIEKKKLRADLFEVPKAFRKTAPPDALKLTQALKQRLLSAIQN